ncbi:MAG TPA: type IV pilin protein [Casimicrobiaceae bacterium]|nr:type IV pilin protein [Casimicrobiaceae bacterium]
MTRAGSSAFTLIETMVVVAIVAVLAAVALPSYAGYVTRSRILEAVARLSDARARMEDYFQDERTYLDGAGHCGAPPPAMISADAFILSCSATATTYTYTATGTATKAMSGFVFSVDQTGARSTVAVPPGWLRAADCWTIRADGLCA